MSTQEGGRGIILCYVASKEPLLSQTNDPHCIINENLGIASYLKKGIVFSSSLMELELG